MTLYDLYASIVKEFGELEKSHTPINKFAFEENFAVFNVSNDENLNGEYEGFRAEKSDGNKKIVLGITTRDNYRPFGNDKEPYHNWIEFYENDKLIFRNSYTYFE
ncbi:MAG: hypothetical protein IJJ69_00845 [Oscillospiraceae bacterium]|nr:hypothetical protein [Oscillospiraceae bacterium]